MSRQNLSALLKAIQRLEHYWAGAGSVSNILEKRRSICLALTNMPGSGLPRVIPRALPTTFISLPDRGLLRRFTTGESYREAIAPIWTNP